MGIDAVGLQPSVTTVPMAMMGRQENHHNVIKKGKVCNICGDAGFDDCLATCSHCSEGAEHVYCMVTIPDTVPVNWVCEGCKVKQNGNFGKRRFVHDGHKPIQQAYKKQILSRVASSYAAKSISEESGLPHNSLCKNISFENGTTHSLSTQADKSPSRGPAQTQPLSMHADKSPPRGPAQIQPRRGGETSFTETNQLSCSKTLTQKLESNFPTNGNSAGIVAQDVKKLSQTTGNSTGVVAQELKKLSHPVIPASGAFAKATPSSETDMAVSTNRGHNDNETITRRDWPLVSSKTLSKSRFEVKSAGVAAPVEGALVKDTPVIALDVEVSRERLHCEEKGIINTNLNPPFKTSENNLHPVETEHHNFVVKEPSYLAAPVEGVLVKDTPAIVLDVEVSRESVQCEDKEITNTDSIHCFKTCEGNILSVEAEHHNLGDTTGFSPSAKEISCQADSVQEESMKGASSSGTGKVVMVCGTAPIHTTSLAKRSSVTACKDPPNYMDISMEWPTSNPPHAIDNSASRKTEFGELLIMSRPHATRGKIAIRDFPSITQKTKTLGEKCETISDLKSKGKLARKVGTPSGVKVLSRPLLQGEGVLAKEETATGQEAEGSCKKLQANEEVNIIDGSFKLSCKGEKGQHHSGDVVIKEAATGQEIDGFCNRLQAKEEGNAIFGSSKPPSLLCEEVKARHQNFEKKAGAAGLPSCLVKSSTIGGLDKVGSVVRVDPMPPVSAAERNIESVAVSHCAMTEPSSGLVPRPEESMKGGSVPSGLEPSSGLVIMQEESMKGASSAGTDKIAAGVHSKRVVRRDFPPLKTQPEKVEKIAGPTRKENITGKVATPSTKGEKQVNRSRSHADTEKVTRRDFPAIPPKAPVGKLEKSASSKSMGNLTGEVVTPLESEDRLSFQQLPVAVASAKHASTIGTETEAVSRRVQAKEEVYESKEFTIRPLLSCETKPAGKTHLCNVKQECDATVLSSCVTKELPTNCATSSSRGEVASVIRPVPKSFELALERETTENFSISPCKEKSSNEALTTFNSAMGPCLPAVSGGITVEDSSEIQDGKKKASGRGHPSNSNGLGNLASSSLDRKHVDGAEGCPVPEQDGEAVEAAVMSSCLVRRFSSHVTSVQGATMKDTPNSRSRKVAYAGKLAPSVEADYDYADTDFSESLTFSPGRHSSGEGAFNRTVPMMAGDSGLRDFLRKKKSAVHSSFIGFNDSTRDRHRNSTFFGREPEDDCFHARHKDGGCEPLDWMGSTDSGPRHRAPMGSDSEFRNMKHDPYSRGSRYWARDFDSYKGAYRCRRCNGVGHSTEFCNIDRQREWRTTDSSDSVDRDLPEIRSEPEHLNRPFPGFHGPDGRKQWRHDPRREETFIDRRSRFESNTVDCAGTCSKRPPKVFEPTGLDEEHGYTSQQRDEAGYERENFRLESIHSSNDEPLEYTRVHKRQIVRVQTQGNRKAGFVAPRPPEHSPPVASPSFKNGKVFPAQGNATSFQAVPAGVPRGGFSYKRPPSQASSTLQDEACRETFWQAPVRSRLQGSNSKNFVQERQAVLDPQVLWTGCLNVSSKTSWSTCYKGIQAHPSPMADPKVFDALLAFPLELELEETKRGVEFDSWPRSFQECPPTSHSIGIYFVPVDIQSHDTCFETLLRRLSVRDLALRINLEFAQLLIYSSQILPEAEQRWNGRFFLWGIFRRNKVSGVIEESSHLKRPSSDKDHGSDLGSPNGNGEVIDMEVDMVGGEDAGSPSLPPGFLPPPPPQPP